MNDDNINYRNKEALILLETIKLKYSREIINLLKYKPNYLYDLIEELQITEEELNDNLINVKNVNITFYDQALTTLQEFMYYDYKFGSNKSK